MTLSLAENVPLAPYTTLGVGGVADYFTTVETIEALREAYRIAKEKGYPVTILGGGSNVLVADAGIRGLTLRPAFSDIAFTMDADTVLMKAGAGVVLDDLIALTVERGYWGLENLSAIPGTVGGVPIQNVGAYGVEARDVVVAVEAYDPHHDAVITLDVADCTFGYRDSVFKHAGAHLVIVSVTFRLHTHATPRLAYKDLALRFPDGAIPTLNDIRAAICSIRAEKFPDWHTVGTAGSFFKNPIITRTAFDALAIHYPALPGFPVGDAHMKVSLGWILDHVCGLRGYTEGPIGLYHAQALVLVVTNEATTDDVLAFSKKIIQKVFDTTGIIIEREVTILS